MPLDATALQRIIDGIEAALAPGLAALRPFLVFWVSTLVLLEALRTYSMLLDDGRRWQHGVAFVLRTLIFVALYWGWPAIMTTVVEDFVHAGLRFGGDQMTVQEFLDPGSLLVKGITTGVVLKDIVMANAGLTGAIYFLPFLVCWLLYLLAYAIMACSVFLQQVELKVVMPVSLLALAFVFWGPTRAMAQGVLSYAVNVAFKFFIKAILASLIFRLAPILTPVITKSTVFDLAIMQAFIMVVTALLLAYLFLKIPVIISQYLAGTPTLSAGSFLQTALGLTALARGVSGLLASGGRGGGTPLPGGRSPVVQGTPVRVQPLPFAANTRVPLPALPAPATTFTILRDGATFLGPQAPSTGGALVPRR